MKSLSLSRRLSLALALAAAVVALEASTVTAQEEQEPKPFEQFLEELLPGMGAESIPDRQTPQQTFQDRCFALGAPGREAERTEACTLIAAKLGPETPKPARVWLLKQLQFIGKGECVDAVAALVGDDDPELHDAARRALQSNPEPAATKHLIDKLQATDDTQRKIGLINSLGAREDAAAVDALSKYLGEEDEAVAAATANALGRIGGTKAADLLAEARTKVDGAQRCRLSDAYLRCADRMVEEGEKAKAAKIYAALDAPEEPRPVQLAAKQGRLDTADDLAALILRGLGSDDDDARRLAAGAITQLEGDAAMKQLATKFNDLPPSGQVLLVDGLAALGDGSAMEVALTAVKSEDPQVKQAGFRALGKLGDASVVPLLTETMFAGGELSGVARESLTRVFGKGVNEAILAAMQKQDDPNRRAQLIDILNKRKAVGAVPALLAEAAAENATVRHRAIQALGDLAEPQHVGAMVDLLLAAADASERDRVERAVWFVCRRIGEPEEQAAPVLAEFDGLSDQQQALLLPLLGRIGGQKALQVIRDGLKSNDEEVQEAAVRGLCNWPNKKVADGLLEIVKEAPQENYRVWALRAYIRVITMRESRPDLDTLARLKEAMDLAERDDERKLIANRASAIRHVETLRWLVPMLDEAALVDDASRSIVELGRHRGLAQPNAEEFKQALSKVIDVCKNEGVTDRARRYREGL
jgi:HEAT repeat protein